MQPVSYARHQFTLEIIRHTVRLYLWFMPRRPFVEVISAASPTSRQPRVRKTTSNSSSSGMKHIKRH